MPNSCAPIIIRKDYGMVYVCIFTTCNLLFQTFLGIFIKHFLREEMVLLKINNHSLIYVCGEMRALGILALHLIDLNLTDTVHKYVKFNLLLLKKQKINRIFYFLLQGSQHIGVQYHLVISMNIIDPKGQLQGQDNGQAAIMPKFSQIIKLISDLNYCLYPLFKDTYTVLLDYTTSSEVTVI